MRTPLLLLTALLAGCGSAPREVRFAIRPSKDLNDYRSVYVLVRAVPDAVYPVETYDDVAAKAMAPDPTVESTVVVLPGLAQEVKVPVPEQGRMAVYALFKQPEDSSWRLLLPAAVPSTVEIRLGRARMCWTSGSTPKGAIGVCGPAPEPR
jgi:predicted component of type VI protein secretion system